MKDLGHQLEEEIAEKEIWLELTHKLQKVDLIHNTTDKRKLSEAWVLDGAALVQLHNAQLEKDRKRSMAGLARKHLLESPGACGRYLYWLPNQHPLAQWDNDLLPRIFSFLKPHRKKLLHQTL